MDYSNLFVVLMGLGTVFFGLVCIIALTYAMGAIMRPRKNSAPVPTAAPAPAAAPVQAAPVQAAPAPAAAAPAAPAAIQPAMIAAISAALAENLGTNVNGIRITSIKKL